jgi:hypothetical protein
MDDSPKNLKPADRHNRHGNVMRKSLLIAFLIALMISGLAFVGSVPFGKAQTSTSVNGIITSDTTWTQANSPYNLTGNILINSGTTVTVGAGTTLNLNGYYIIVNGSLIVQQGVTINMGNGLCDKII